MFSTLILLVILAIGGPPAKQAPPDATGKKDVRRGANRSDWQSDVKNDRRVFKSDRDMSDADKKEMRQRRWHLNRLHKEVKKSFQCKKCKGTGYVIGVVGEGGKQRGDVAREAPVPCPTCGGTAEAAAPKVFTKLDEFFARRDVYERVYPFEKKIALDTEDFVLTKARGIGRHWFNLDFFLRASGGQLQKGDTVIVAIELGPVEKRNRKAGRIYGFSELDREEYEIDEILVEAGQAIPPDINGWSKLLVLASYERSEAVPDDFTGKKRHRHILRPRLIEKLVD